MNQENQNSEGLEVQKKPLARVFVVSVTLLVAVLALTGYFAYRNYSLDADIANEQNRLAGYEASIQALSQDPGVQAMDLLRKAKPEILKTMDRSNVAKYVRELDELRTKYSVNFTGFNFANNAVSTTVNAPRSPIADPVSKTAKFISDYRDGTASGSFLLSPVSTFAGGNENRTFAVQLNIK